MVALTSGSDAQPGETGDLRDAARYQARSDVSAGATMSEGLTAAQMGAPMRKNDGFAAWSVAWVIKKGPPLSCLNLTDVMFATSGVVPPIFGTAADAASLARSLGKGDWWAAAFDVIGFVPLLGDGTKGARVANTLADLGRVVDELAAGTVREF